MARFVFRDNLVPVVQRVDNAIRRINHYPVGSVAFLPTLIHWIAIYPEDSVVHALNNLALNVFRLRGTS